MTVTSEVDNLLEVSNRDGRTIRCLLELPETGQTDAPCVIVAPSYALSMRHFGPLSLFLTRNGFRCLRFDYTDHVGASAGDVYDFRLSSAADDLGAVLGAVRDWGVSGPVGVVSVSSILAMILFKERLSRLKTFGLAVGLMAVALLNR